MKLFFLLIPLLLLSSCSDASDIESDLLVAGISVDKGESSPYKISAEVITTESSGDSANVKSKVISAEGETVLDAVNEMISESSKKLNFDHCSVLILGSDISPSGLSDVLDLAFRNNGLRLSMQTVTAKNCKGSEILNSNSVVNVIRAYEIAETVKINAESVGFATEAAVYTMLNDMNSLSHSALCPAYTLKNDVFDENVNLLQGLAVFKDGAFAGFTENNQSQFILMASGDFKKGAVPCYIPSHNALMTVQVESFKRRLSTETDGRYAEIHLHLSTEVSLPEIPENVTVKTSDQSSIIETDISNFIARNVYAAVTDTLNRYGAEVFGFSSKILAQHREFCRRNAHRWDELLKRLKIKVTCDVKITNSGSTNDRILSKP